MQVLARSIACLAVGATARGESIEEAWPSAGEGECGAEDAECALSLLQLRGAKVAEAAEEAEQDEDEYYPHGGSYHHTTVRHYGGGYGGYGGGYHHTTVRHYGGGYGGGYHHTTVHHYGGGYGGGYHYGGGYGGGYHHTTVHHYGGGYGGGYHHSHTTVHHSGGGWIQEGEKVEGEEDAAEAQADHPHLVEDLGESSDVALMQTEEEAAEVEAEEDEDALVQEDERMAVEVEGYGGCASAKSVSFCHAGKRTCCCKGGWGWKACGCRGVQASCPRFLLQSGEQVEEAAEDEDALVQDQSGEGA